MPQCAQRTISSALPGLRGGRMVGLGGLRLRALFCDTMRAMIMATRIATTQNKTLPNFPSLQDDVQYKVAACIGQQQEGKTGQGPAQSNATPPSILFPAP